MRTLDQDVAWLWVVSEVITMLNLFDHEKEKEKYVFMSETFKIVANQNTALREVHHGFIGFPCDPGLRSY